ncbi:MAG: hypothetical protein HY286_00935 [Planctomycetes bacterium]|nr:hypothetical protein [Planctomycetota bacterium]
MSDRPDAGQSWGCLSWPIIIIAFFLCQPLGAVLLILRLSRDRSQRITSGRILQFVGFGFAILFGIASISVARYEAGPRMGFVFLLFLGALFVGLKGTQLVGKAAATRRYMNLIINQKYDSVDEIAAALKNSNIMDVEREIQEIIDQGFLPGYRLDRDTRRIIKIGGGTGQPPVVSSAGAGAAMVYTCRGCGAHNEAPRGGVVRCDYCDTPNKVG